VAWVGANLDDAPQEEVPGLKMVKICIVIVRDMTSRHLVNIHQVEE